MALKPVEKTNPQTSLVDVMADKFGMLPDEFIRTVKATCFPGITATNEQFLTFLAIAREHNLSPFTREIFAFQRPGGGIQTIVSIDGWMKIINAHPQFDGMGFTDNLAPDGKLVSVTCTIHRRDRGHPVQATEYMDECKRSNDVWRQWPKRMLRHKAAIQAARYAFSFAGFVEPDEADRVRDIDHKTIAVESLKTDFDKIADDLPEPEIVEAVEEPDRLLNDEEREMVERQFDEAGLTLKQVKALLKAVGVHDFPELRISHLKPLAQEVAR